MWCEDEGANQKVQLCGTPGILLWPEETSPEGDGSHCQESDGSIWGHKGVF